MHEGKRPRAGRTQSRRRGQVGFATLHEFEEPEDR
jgi:hypothetical protein